MNYPIKLTVTLHYVPTVCIPECIPQRNTHTQVHKGSRTMQIITTLFTAAGANPGIQLQGHRKVKCREYTTECLIAARSDGLDVYTEIWVDLELVLSEITKKQNKIFNTM